MGQLRISGEEVDVDRAGLIERLQTHEPSDEAERANLAAILALVRQAAQPASRSHFLPGHLTASAFVLSPDGAALLLIHHRRLGRWLQPGGHVDAEDVDLEAAARREVEEETGLRDLEPAAGRAEILDVDVHVIPAHPGRGEPEHSHFDVRWLFRARGSELRAGSDVTAARWVPLDEVEGWETDESVLRAVRRIRARP